MPALFRYAALFGIFLSVASGTRSLRRGVGDVSQHRLSFTQVLATSIKSEAFQKQLSSTVPTLCDGAEQAEQCKDTITKALVCTSFVEKAKQFPPDMEGIKAFINKCDRIERRVPNFSSVVHWIQTPDELFQQAVGRAEKRTGIDLGNLAAGSPEDGDNVVSGDAPAGLPALTGPLDQLNPDADVNNLPPLPQ